MARLNAMLLSLNVTGVATIISPAPLPGRISAGERREAVAIMSKCL